MQTANKLWTHPISREQEHVFAHDNTDEGVNWAKGVRIFSRNENVERLLALSLDVEILILASYVTGTPISTRE